MRMNKKERYVMSMSDYMGHDLSLEQQIYFQTVLPDLGFLNKGKIYCTECGHHFEVADAKDGDKIECPHCHKMLKVSKTRKIRRYDRQFAAITHSWGSHWQVLRFFEVGKVWRADDTQYSYSIEVMQIWLGDDGSKHYISLDKAMYPNRQFNPFNLWSKFKIRRPWQGYNYYGTFDIRRLSYDSIRVESIAPFLRKRGVTKRSASLSSGFYFDTLFDCLNKPMFETLLKQKRYGLMRGMLRNTVWGADCKEIIAAIKVALRHGYFDKHKFHVDHTSKRDKTDLYSDWFDMIRLMKEQNIDIHNPKLICVENVAEYHKKLIDKAEKKRKEQERLIELRENAKFNPDYIKAKQKFLSMELKDRGITIKPLQNVDEFMNEGEEMHHCVYRCKYFLKDESLILSARLGDWSKPDEILETIEVNLDSMTIVQSRGHCNMPSEYHKQIVDMVNNNMETIKKYKYT